MPFIDNSTFEKLEKKEKIHEKVQRLKENETIKKIADGGEKQNQKVKVSFKDILKAQTVEKEPKLSITEMKQNIKINQLIEDKRAEEIDKLLQNGEIHDMKNDLVGVLSMTHTNPLKRQIFNKKLQESEIINNYIDKNVLYRLLHYTGENVRFGLVYGLKFLQTENDYKRIETQLKMLKEQQQQQQAQPQPKEEKEQKPQPSIQVEIKTDN